MSPRVKTSLNPPSSKPTLRALLRKASENTTRLKSEVKYEAVVPVEDERDPETGVYSESSNYSHNYSTRDTSMPPSESESANKVFISSVGTKSQLVPKSTTMIYGEKKPHKRSENATGAKTDLERKAIAPVQDTRDPDSSMQSEPFITDNCSTRDTSIPTSESLSVDNSDLELAESFDLVADSSSSIAIESPFDIMGRFACTCADVFLDYKSVESFHSLDMAEDKEKSSQDDSSSLGEMSSSNTGSTDEIDWNYTGGLNKHEDKVSRNEISVEDVGSLGKVLDMADDKKKRSPDESASLGKMNSSDTGSMVTDWNYTGGLGKHEDKAGINEISFEDLGSLGKVSISIQTRSVTNENKTSAKSEPFMSRAVVDASMPRGKSSVELARSLSKKAVESFIPKTAAKRKSLSFRLKKFLSKG